jgi:hypothetical protein
MPNTSARRNQVTREAAAELLFYAGFIVGFCFLVLLITVWNQSEPEAPEPFYSTVPGVNMERLPPANVEVVLKKLNLRRCHCGCMRSLASCRNHHGSCAESIVAAQDEVNTAGRR